MKHIDADKLLAEIERQKKAEGWCEVGKDTADVYYARGFRFACDNLLFVITSLEQEQPEVDFEKEFAKFSNDSDAMDYAFPICLADYKDFARHFYEFGFNARKEKLPEIELDKFIDKVDTFKARYKHPESISIKGAMAFMARMFYQYPNVARQWYEQLPKATMD